MKFYPQLAGDSLLGLAHGPTAEDVSYRALREVPLLLERGEGAELDPEPHSNFFAVQKR